MPRPTRAHPDGSAAAQMYALNTQFQSNRNRRDQEPPVAPPRSGPSFPGGVEALTYTPSLPSPFLRPSGPRQQLGDRGVPNTSREDVDGAGVGVGGNVPRRAPRVPFWQTMDNSDDELGPDYTPSRGSRHSASSGYNASNYQSDFGDFSFLLGEKAPQAMHSNIPPQAFGGDDINASGFGGDGDIEGPPPSPVPAQRFPEDDLSDWEEEEWLGIGNQGSSKTQQPPGTDSYSNVANSHSVVRIRFLSPSPTIGH